MGSVFISYRREETAGEARALYNDLAATLGTESVFMDVDTIALGRDFRDAVRERLASADIVLALIGKDWVSLQDAAGRRRLDDPDDFVRLEIEGALKRGVPVIPVLVQGAEMPSLVELPAEIRDFTFRNAFELSHNRWESDVRELLRRLALDRHDGETREESLASPPQRAQRGRWLVLTAAAALSVTLAGGAFVYLNSTVPGDSEDRDQRGAHEVGGVIREKWAAVGRERGPLGDAVADETPTFDQVGRWQQFKGGMISWHPETGAHIVWGPIGERWLQIGREQFGYPISDEVWTPDQRGRASDFRAVHLAQKPVASIYWSPETGAHEVFGAIRDKWIELGAERSPLGYPLGREEAHGAGFVQRFQRGSLAWTPRGGAVIQ